MHIHFILYEPLTKAPRLKFVTAIILAYPNLLDKRSPWQVKTVANLVPAHLYV